ncbi:anti-sigma B factor RsbW [Aureibacillus halotolerans]|uniref:Serine-protein kinase RsbW n=1 Tax=Aureibacillus halotolerans TaxID=1508390 RepID=A0A4V3D4M1_9BACI|nr:anti-sigma B factor RsbW [Aureibacillus halotolerans]TDQ36717.1 serine/threonine-protein kinase RsbW [Aureibacillus halotolerans]
MKEVFDFVEMTIPAKPEYVGVVRLTVSGVANRMGFNYEEIEDVKVALSEACTNAVHHAYQDDEDGEIKIGFGVYEDRLELMVSDSGKSIDLNGIKKKLGPVSTDTPVDHLTEGGLGLFLIDTLMDKVELTSEAGVVVLMTKFLERDEVEDSVDTISAPQQN